MCWYAYIITVTFLCGMFTVTFFWYVTRYHSVVMMEEKMHVNVTQPMTLCLRVWEPSLAGVSTRCFPLSTFNQCASHAVCVSCSVRLMQCASHAVSVKRRENPGVSWSCWILVLFSVFVRPAGHDITILVDRCKKIRKFLVRPNLEKQTAGDQRLAGALKLEIQGS